MNKTCENILLCYVVPVIGFIIIVIVLGTIRCIDFLLNIIPKRKNI